MSFLMEAHNGLSAKIVEETGFQGIWASGLSISAALGVRDSNEASWTQVLDVVEFMSESTNIPILLDGDTGYGNFNNARRLIKKLESRGVAGVCLEDKLFPKTNSFIDGETQQLAHIDEFCGKIVACKETQNDPDFMVVARLEAFITGLGLEEAYKRAEAYHMAGADAILCHSKKKDDTDIEAFMELWGNRCPVIIVPTKYYHVPTEKFEKMGVSTIIWANHNMRASVKAIQNTTQSIFDNQSLAPVETSETIVPVSEVFRLQNTSELKTAEDKYSSFRPMNETEMNKLSPGHFYRQLLKHGSTYFSGVPDSLLKDICAFITKTVPAENHVISANEGTALGTAAGHYLATNKIPVVYLQNSGLGNLVNPLLSLCSTSVYSLPVLMLIGWRGEPGKKDEPQHQLQGSLTPSMLKTMGIPFEILPDYEEGCDAVLEIAYKHMQANKGPFALLVKKGTFEAIAPEVFEHKAQQTPGMLHREEILEHILHQFPKSPAVTTTGFTSREVFELRERLGQSHEKEFLTVGSMGHCSSIAMGIATAKKNVDVLAIDGDGAALMHLGAMAIAGHSGLKNFKHIIVNNGMHDSVGGQPTVGFDMDWLATAKASGYSWTKSASTKEDIRISLKELAEAEGPALLELKALPGARVDLGRPTTSTIANRDAFMQYLATV